MVTPPLELSAPRSLSLCTLSSCGSLHLVLYSAKESMFFDCPLGPVSGFTLSKQYWACQYHGVSLKSNQRVDGYSHTFYAAVTLERLAGRSPLYIEGFVARLVFTFLPC